MIELVVELFREIAHEIVVDPVKFGIELAQFAALVFIIKGIGFGFGEKPGMVTNMLRDRAERVRAELAEADSAIEELDAAHDLARETARRARSEARRIVADAKTRAADERVATLAAAEEEAAELRRQADQALAKERAEMLGGLREQLVELVAEGTKQILDQGYTAAEQRSLIQKAVIESLDDLETVSLS